MYLEGTALFLPLSMAPLPNYLQINSRGVSEGWAAADVAAVRPAFPANSPRSLWALCL